MDPKKQPSRPAPGPPAPDSPEDLGFNSTVDEFFQRLQSDMRHPLPSQEAVSAARQAVQRLAAESAGAAGFDIPAENNPAVAHCTACGHRNRPGNRFCGLCGLPLNLDAVLTEQAAPGDVQPSTSVPVMPEGQHHYHHHYHHHYFAAGAEPAAGLAPRASALDPAASKVRSLGAGITMSRVETAVRKVMHDWARACNSRQLDDLVSTYSPDALVLRPNHPAVRGSAAIREFFFAVLDAGFGEVELDPLRLDVVGDVAYEAGRCKMLVPVAVSKRREERGKYLAVLARQPNGEWAIVCDCWSSDLSLAASGESESPKPAGSPPAGVKPAPPRKLT